MPQTESNRRQTIGYLRVSMIDQDIEKNKADILKLASDRDLGKVEFDDEKVSGKVCWRSRKIACQPKANQHLRRQGKLAAGWEHPEQDHRHGVCDGGRDRTRVDFPKDQRIAASRKASGAKRGRPKGPGKSKLDPFQPEIEGLLANGATQKFIAGRYGATEANLHNWLKKRGLKA